MKYGAVGWKCETLSHGKRINKQKEKSCHRVFSFRLRSHTQRNQFERATHRHPIHTITKQSIWLIIFVMYIRRVIGAHFLTCHRTTASIVSITISDKNVRENGKVQSNSLKLLQSKWLLLSLVFHLLVSQKPCVCPKNPMQSLCIFALRFTWTSEIRCTK